MASADFPEPLSPGLSLGQYRPFPFAPSGSTCSVDDSRASLIPACSPPVARLTARSCSYSRRFASGPFRGSLSPSLLAVRLRLSSSPRRGPFTPIGTVPARHTGRAIPFARDRPEATPPSCGRAIPLARDALKQPLILWAGDPARPRRPEATLHLVGGQCPDPSRTG